MKTFFFSLLQLLPLVVWAQISGQGGLMSNDQTYISAGKGLSMVNGVPVETNKNLYEGVKGSPFLCKTFVKGYIITKDTSNRFENLTYNFDTYKQELHVRYPNHLVKILFNSELIGFQLSDKGVLRNFKKLKINGLGEKFYEVIAESAQYSCVKLWATNFMKANPVDRGVVQTGLYDEFVEYQKYFLKVRNQYLELDKLSKKNFIKIMPKQEQLIEKIWGQFEWGKKITEMEIPQLLKALEENIQK